MEPDVFLTVEEVARRMRVSKMTIYRLINATRLGAVRVGRSYRIKQTSLNEYLKGRGKDDVPPAG